MKIHVFSILDEKSKVFSQPFFMTAKGQAVRAFSDLVADKNSAIARHPEDYRLYLLGEFDDLSGAFVSLPQPEYLYAGSDFTENKEV